MKWCAVSSISLPSVYVSEASSEPLELVVEDRFEGVEVPLHVDEGRLELFHVHRSRELEMELIEGEQVGRAIA